MLPVLDEPSRSSPIPPHNAEVAALLERIAELLHGQKASEFRVRAFRRGAETLRSMPDSIVAVLDEGGRKGLEALPGIGRTMARLIEEYVRTGQCRALERLEGNASPEALFTSLPGIGPKLAQQLHDELGIATLEDLEMAAHDGRLQGLRGIGPRRAEALRYELDAILRARGQRQARRTMALRAGDGDRPPVRLLLDADAVYRRRAAAGELRRIAPRRFNPSGEAWLPIMHDERDGWELTVLYSNTARAHELDRTHDWVVVYYTHDGTRSPQGIRDGHEGQCTVVTKRQGPLAGQRVVRGRELECQHDYDALAPRRS